MKMSHEPSVLAPASSTVCRCPYRKLSAQVSYPSRRAIASTVAESRPPLRRTTAMGRIDIRFTPFAGKSSERDPPIVRSPDPALLLADRGGRYSVVSSDVGPP